MSEPKELWVVETYLPASKRWAPSLDAGHPKEYEEAANEMAQELRAKYGELQYRVRRYIPAESEDRICMCGHSQQEHRGKRLHCRHIPPAGTTEVPCDCPVYSGPDAIHPGPIEPSPEDLLNG